MKASQLRFLSLSELKDHYDCINWLISRSRHRIDQREPRNKVIRERVIVERELMARAEVMGYKIEMPIRPTQLRYPTLTQLTKLSTLELAEQLILFKRVTVTRDEGIDQNMDCTGEVCNATRYNHARGKKKAAEQIRRIEIILSYR